VHPCDSHKTKNLAGTAKIEDEKDVVRGDDDSFMVIPISHIHSNTIHSIIKRD
jgi:hypothetical protein